MTKLVQKFYIRVISPNEMINPPPKLEFQKKMGEKYHIELNQQFVPVTNTSALNDDDYTAIDVDVSIHLNRKVTN